MDPGRPGYGTIRFRPNCCLYVGYLSDAQEPDCHFLPDSVCRRSNRSWINQHLQIDCGSNLGRVWVRSYASCTCYSQRNPAAQMETEYAFHDSLKERR